MLDSLAAAYARSRTGEDRDRLCAAAMSLVRRIATLLARRLPNHFSNDDLVGDGCLGLLRAMDRFDPAYGVSFETFASRIIRGAMLNGLRRMDVVPERLRRNARQLDYARWQLAVGNGAEPADGEVAAGAGLTRERLESVQLALRTAAMISLQSAQETNSGIPLSERLASGDPDPAEVVARRDLHAVIGRAVGVLADRDRLILRVFYSGKGTFKDLGRHLGVSKQRVSQIHNRALGELRGVLAVHFAET